MVNHYKIFVSCFRSVMAASTSSQRIRCNKTDSFCYMCSLLTPSNRISNTTQFVKESYFAYFGLTIHAQDKSWAPHYVRATCVSHLRLWTDGRRSQIPFRVPMIWREPRDHTSCHFCMKNTVGYTFKMRHLLKYQNVPSATRPVPHSTEKPVPLNRNLDLLN